MKKENNIEAVLKAQDEYAKAISAESGVVALNNGTPGGSSSVSIGAILSFEEYFASIYRPRLEAEREFQRQKMEIIKAGNLEESTVVGQNLDEVRAKEDEDHKVKLGNTKSMIGSSLSLMQSLMRGSKKNNKAMFEADKAVSVGMAIMSAHTGAARALKDYPAPISYLVAATALANGLASARSIASQRMTTSVSSSGGGFGGASSQRSSGSSTVPYGGPGGDENRGTQNIVVNIHNPLSDENWAKIVEDNIIPALEGAGERNVLLNVNV
jgi:hypothetical protein